MEFQAAAGSLAASAAGRKASLAGSMLGSSAGQAGRRLVPDFEFSVSAAKVKVLKSLEESVPAAFVRFYSSTLFDRLLHGLVLYFCSLFQQELLSRTAERGRGGHAEGCNPQLLSGRLRELDEELSGRRSDLSQPYCEIVLKHSSYKNQQQDKRFFESLYAALTALMHEAFDRLGRQAVLEQELGRLFRGKHFNVASRVHGPQRSVDSMTVMQLWEVKNEAHNRALHSQLISSLFEKAPTLSVQVAAVSNTPLVSQAVNSPLVARSLLADPAERDILLALPYSRTPKKTQAAAGRSTGSPVSIRPPLGSLASPGAKAAEAGGNNSPRTTTAAPALLACSSISIAAAPSLAAAAGGTPGPRASTIKPFQGVVASLPEAAGLPYDEHYAYLCLLRRSVLYGATLGLPTGPPGNPVGRSGMLSLTGSAAAGSLSRSSSVVFRM